MNKELAKTLTLALVNYLDENRPEGAMDCSNIECESIEKMLEGEHFGIVAALVEKKLSRLTEFEKELAGVVCEWGDSEETKISNYVKKCAPKLLALAKKELLKDDELAKKHLEGYCMGREDTLREMMDYVESHFHGKKAKEFDTPTINIPAWEPPCYRGGPCTNPMRDCINCPGTTAGGGFSTSSGTSTAVLHGNISATDGEPHNPSFTD